MARTPITDPTLPNLLDQRSNRLAPRDAAGDPFFRYELASDGAVVLGISYAGLVKGLSPQGRRFESLEAAAAAVRAARPALVARFKVVREIN